MPITATLGGGCIGRSVARGRRDAHPGVRGPARPGLEDTGGLAVRTAGRQSVAMRSVVQRVSSATLQIGGRPHAEIGRGLVVLVGIEVGDTPDDPLWMSGKIARLRVFPDEAGQMNRSVVDVGGEVLVVSQFTLLGSTRKGNRPSFTRSAPPEMAIPAYEAFLTALSAALGKPPACGVFGAEMQVGLVNDGPVTLVLDTRWRE